MKKLLTTMLLATATLAGWAQVWIDVTDKYVVNPRFDKNDIKTGWEGVAFSANNPAENAEHYNKNYDTYQTIKGLAPGKYRVSVSAFYRMGSASNDYSLYDGGNYKNSQHAKLYAKTAAGEKIQAIVPASSAALTESLGGKTAEVGNSGGGWPWGGGWGWWGVSYYIPDDMEAAHLWFEEGYYHNELECKVGEDGELTIGIRKTQKIDNDWTCLDNWKLEYYGDASEIANSIVINEIMAANVDTYLDPSFNYGSWVELYNPSDVGFSLGGLYVTDDPQNMKKHRLIDSYGDLPAKGYAILNFDHYEVYTMPSYRQIDDKLDCDGGTIIISDGTNSLAQLTYPEAISRCSYARTTDGGDTWQWTGKPSPGKSNQAGGGFAETQLAAPVVDKDAQVFEGNLQVSVNFPESAILRYTTDGTAPTLTNGKTSSTGQFNVKSTTCYRFRVFQNGFLPSTVVTRTYILKEKNYAFPIISVVTDDKNLNSEEYGVFVQGQNGRPGSGQDNACNWNMDWDRPVSVEYLTAPNDKGERECVVSQECDLTMCGGWSRAWTPHSFKLKASKTYDFQNFFAAQLFEKKPYIKNKTLQIRNGGNDVQTYGERGGRIRDAILQQIVARSGLNIDYQEWQPVHVLINGKYYATLSMREPNNKHHAYANYGIDTNSMDQFEFSADSGYVQMEGTDEAWLRLVELSKNADKEDTYAQIRQLIDMDEYINLMAAEFYLGGTDWPHNNVKGYRDRNGGKFRFVLFDLDFAGETTTPFQNFFGKENFQSEHPLAGYDYSQNKSIDGTQKKYTNTFVTLFKNLLKNDEFRKQFIDTYCIFGGSVMLPKYVKDIANEMRDYMKKGIYQEDRFDPSISSNYVINKFNANWNKNIVDHMQKRSEMGISKVEKQTVNIQSSLEDAKITVNGIELPYTEFDGYLFAPITVKAIAPAGYRFVRWTSGKEKSDALSTEEEYTLPTSGKQTLYATFEKIPADELPDEGISVRINEVSAANSMYVNDYFKKDDWIELYNTTDKPIDIKGMYISDEMGDPMKYQVPSDDVNLNTIIPAHGYKVIWCDKRENIGSEIHAGFKLASEGGDVTITIDAYTDAIHYDTHTGVQTFGRYPDGGNDTYVMNHPTIAKANQISSYDTLYVKPIDGDIPGEIPGGSDDIRTYTKEGGISIAYVGGVINVKSEDSPIRSAQLVNASGMKMTPAQFVHNGGRFISIDAGTLPKGIYIVTAITQDGDECHTKFFIK